jgi:beta-xylosidase
MKPIIILALLITGFTALKADDVYTNPVLHPDNYPDVSSAADPFVFKDHDGTYYCYVTGQGFPVFSSRDLVHWTYERRAFPKARAKWATANFWAPEVIKVGNYYYLHYTASETDDSPKRIGLARSSAPVGPFDDVSDSPYYSLGAKGCIDSHIFIDDDNRTYLYYSLALRENVVNGVNRSEIWVVELNADLSGVKSAAKQLFYPTHSWESNVNEAPTILKRNGIYYLMYSGNGYANANYAVGYATSTSPAGPFAKYASNPILIHTGLGKQVTGTGHNSVTTSPDGTELICVYHSHINLDELGGGPRKVNIDRIGFTSDHILYIDGPTLTPQNYPSSTQLSQPWPRHKKGALTIYPNPATHQITITIPSPHAGAVKISDLNGRTLYTQTFPCNTDQLTLPLQTLSQGTYLIQLQTQNIIQNDILIKA